MKYLIIISLINFFVFPHFTQAQNEKREWVFMNQKNGKVKSYKEGQYLKINWHEGKKQKTFKGKLSNISEDSVSLKLGGINFAVAKKDVETVRIGKHGGNWLTLALGILVFLAGLVLTIAGFVLGPALNTAASLAGLKSSTEFKLVGIGGIILMFSGVGLMLMPEREKIPQPFNENWISQEVPPRPKNMP